MGSEYSSFLDPDAISKGEMLGLIAREIVEGYRVGEHRSPFHGFAIEFAQHREYSTGDDLRHLDWKVLGRTDRYYIKQYEQDTNFVVHLLVDGSESMAYGSGKLTKLHYAKILAACLVHIILRQGDAVALNIFDSQIRERFARTDNAGKIHEIIHRLARFEAGQGTRIGKALHDLAASIKARSIVILVSDLFDDEEELRRNLDRLRFQGCEVILFQVLDPRELDFQLEGRVRFVGYEGAQEVQTTPSAIRKSYLEAFNQFLGRIRRSCEKTGSHYVLANTGGPLAETLSEYLAFRKNHRTR